ncbi:MAG: UTRA domain-containing protein, partial [Lachnospiraceae bacterium]|nr:UTRA domain-containing protein [Lachnospiraceae bacterium]
NYIPYSLCSYILSHDFEKESLYEILSQKPETAPCMVKNIISAEEATARDAELLGVSPGKPLLNFCTISRTRDNRLIDYAFSRYHGEFCKYEVEVCRD